MGRFEVDDRALRWALDRLALVAPEATERARPALRQVLAGVYGSAWPRLAWAFSRLTGDGFPLELSFHSASEEIRFTAEASGPEIPRTLRLERAAQSLLELSDATLPSEMREMFDRVQEAGELRWGAWLGGRHSRCASRYKLYGEVPCADAPVVRDLLRRLLGKQQLLRRRHPALRIIGYEPASCRLELYFAIGFTDRWDVEELLDTAGLFEQRHSLFALLEEVAEHSIDPKCLGANYGFSYSLPLLGGPVAVSLYTPAHTLTGGDGATRRRLLSLAVRKGWPLRGYEALTEPLRQRSGPRTRHGLLGFVLSSEAEPMLYIGLRPALE